MFGKLSKAQFAGVLYDTVLKDTNELGKTMKANELLQEKLYADRTTFTAVSFAIHFVLYREILIKKYRVESVSNVITLCIDEYASHPTNYQANERKRAFIEVYNELSRVIINSINNAKRNHLDPFDDIAAVALLAFFDDQLDPLIAEQNNYDESLDALSDCIADHFRRLEMNSGILDLPVRM